MNLTRENTAIVLDSTADFPEGPERFSNWRIVPLYVRFGDETFRDYVDLAPDAFYARLADAPEPPKTAAPSPGDFAAVYQELAGYDRVFSLHLDPKLSGTIGSASTAAQDFPNVRVIESGCVSAGTAMIALAVQRRLERGTTDDEIDALIERFRAERDLIVTLDTLEYLARGGRIGRAAAFAGSLLSVKPILTLRDGEVVPVKRVRGAQQALGEFRATLEAKTRDEPSLHVAIAHAAAPERAREAEAIVRSVRPRAQVDAVVPLGSVVGTHAGPGALALFWFDDPVQ